MACDNKTKINQLFNDLTGDYSSSFPNINWNDSAFKVPQELLDLLNQEHKAVDISDVTVKRFDGTGSFDVIMSSAAAHLKEEFKANRITGSDYTKAWISLMESSLVQAVGFTLQKDEAKWKAIQAQLEAITAVSNLKLVQAQIAALKADEAAKKASYGLIKAQIVTEELNQCQITAQTANITAEGLNIPKQGLVLDKQAEQLQAQTDKTLYEVSTYLPADVANKTKQTELLNYELTTIKPQELVLRTNEALLKKYELEEIAPQELALKAAQVDLMEFEAQIKEFELLQKVPAEVSVLLGQVQLIKEQMETQRANTQGTRTDGATVVGAVGKQIALQDQQIESYKKDIEIKIAKIYADAWNVHETTVEPTVRPTEFEVPKIDNILPKLRTGTGLV